MHPVLGTATVWIGYIRWPWDNGFGRPPEPILLPAHPLETGRGFFEGVCTHSNAIA